ncbi:glycosyl hydrolase [Halorubrum sp. Hd13]|uniref:glycosyl hydrolase n=1 Tax=Halorubrum sp. Hd13 TaxID=1480728 RepID=UPI000B992239|nr:glycosyl hydrolase [Halorubrum sp. Hd13]OYR46155.1 glycosyl hydrolase [Halorubrum sp. Hd13]
MSNLKLGGVEDGVVHATRGLSVGTWSRAHGFEPSGSIPGSGTVARLSDSPVVGGLLARLTGSVTTTNLWPIGGDRLLATVGDELFLSTDRGRSWRVVRRLPESSGPMGVLPSAVCRHEGRVYLAEYPLGDETAKVAVSEDGSRWSTHVSRSDVRHFHGLFHDPYTGSLWGTTGDTDGESAIGRFVDGKFRPVGRGSQTWRAVDLAFTPESVLWGMDCSYAPRIEILRLSRDDIPPPSTDRHVDRPAPKAVATVDGPVFYAETVRSDETTWVVFSTASTTGTDSTGPKNGGADSGAVRVIAASRRSGYERWHQLVVRERAPALGAAVPRVPTANAYAFLASTASREVLINPFNTSRSNGEILVRRPSSFGDAPRLPTEVDALR